MMVRVLAWFELIKAFLVGGRMEVGETHDTCLKRECIEEIGYDIEFIKHICSANGYVYLNDLGYYQMIQHYYFVKLKEFIKPAIDKDHHFIMAPYRDRKMKIPMQDWAIHYFLEMKDNI